MIFKKVLQTVSIYPSTKGTLGFLENYDEFESIPAAHENDEHTKLGLTTPVGEVRSRDTKDAYINNKLNPNIDLNTGRTGDIYKFTRVA